MKNIIEIKENYLNTINKYNNINMYSKKGVFFDE